MRARIALGILSATLLQGVCYGVDTASAPYLPKDATGLYYGRDINAALKDGKLELSVDKSNLANWSITTDGNTQTLRNDRSNKGDRPYVSMTEVKTEKDRQYVTRVSSDIYSLKRDPQAGLNEANSYVIKDGKVESITRCSDVTYGGSIPGTFSYREHFCYVYTPKGCTDLMKKEDEVAKSLEADIKACQRLDKTLDSIEGMIRPEAELAAARERITALMAKSKNPANRDAMKMAVRSEESTGHRLYEEIKELASFADGCRTYAKVLGIEKEVPKVTKKGSDGKERSVDKESAINAL